MAQAQVIQVRHVGTNGTRQVVQIQVVQAPIQVAQVQVIQI